MSRASSPAARWTGYVLVAIAFAVACAFLSHWQFDRNEERAAQLALVEANYDAEPVPLGEVLSPGAALAPADEWTPVELRGEYLVDDTLLVRNRPHAGTAAFEVLVPFRLDDGRVVVVDRGWLPPGDTSPEPDAVPAPTDGPATITVRLRPGEPLPGSGRSADEGQVPTIHLPLVAERTGLDVETGAYGLLVSEDPAVAPMPGTIDPPSDDPGPHLSYAVQWILFAVMGFGFIGYIIVTERRHRREEAAEAAAETVAPAAPRRRGRRDRDADDEDALLDSVSR